MEYLQKAKTIPQVPFPRTINFYIDECEENVLERTKLTNLLVTLESGKFIAIGRDCSDTNLSTRRSGKQFIDVRINLLGRLSISRVQLVLKKNYDGTFIPKPTPTYSV